MYQTLRVIVADDHPIYRDGVVGALAACDDIEVTAACARAEEALAAVRAGADVALIDYVLPDFDGMELLARVTAENLPTRVLLISAFIDGDRVTRALEAGAAGYIAKEASRSEICDAVRRVGRGESVIGKEVQTALVEHMRARVQRPQHLLTPRESEILALLADGLSTAQIAERLVLGSATIKTHLHHVYDKLGVGDRAAAVAEGRRRGLVQ